MRVQGINCEGEVLSSAFVKRLEDNTGIDCSSEPSLTRQEFKEECDINVLMERYQKTGEMPVINSGTPQYADFTEMPTDLRGMHELMQKAGESFMRLPAKVRAEFDNDPLRFVDFASEPSNLEQMRSWGLAAPKEPPPAPIEVKVVSEVPPVDAVHPKPDKGEK